MTRPAPLLASVLALLLACFTAPAAAQPAADIAVAIPPPAQVDWPGTLTLAVDATDLDHRVLQVRQTVPVAPGRLTLLYPRWLPGTHGPYADFDRVAGPTITAGGQRLPWRRDTAEPYALHVDVPAGTTELELRYDVVTPLAWSQGRPSMTRALLGVQWDQVVLYPAGHAASRIRYAPSVKLPAGWRQASALRDASGAVAEPGADGWVRFAPVSLETLVDSPLFAGPNLKRVPLSAEGSTQAVVLNLVGDTPEVIAASEPQLAAHRALLTQATRAFGPGHWRHYDFLLAISDAFGGIGLEHTESSENGVGTRYFKDWDASLGGRDLLPHEFTHAWNGKYRRPAGLETPNYNVPMRNELLWVYEGMTTYWAWVLTARSGLGTVDQSIDRLAQMAATQQARTGRSWRNLQDTTNDPALGSSRRKPWIDQLRGVDYYPEGMLLWLDVDTTIRAASNGKRSLDDVARALFGGATVHHPDGSPAPQIYTFADLVRVLNGVQPLDWAAFLRTRLDGTEPVLGGLAGGGWKLDWAAEESRFAKAAEGRSGDRSAEFGFDLGLVLSQGASAGRIERVAWGSPAFRAGLAPEQTVVAVNRRAYSPDVLSAALVASQKEGKPLALLVREGDTYRDVVIDYREGPRHPRLARVAGTPDRLADILRARPD